jgi:hypothetical protein
MKTLFHFIAAVFLYVSVSSAYADIIGNGTVTGSVGLMNIRTDNGIDLVGVEIVDDGTETTFDGDCAVLFWSVVFFQLNPSGTGAPSVERARAMYSAFLTAHTTAADVYVEYDIEDNGTTDIADDTCVISGIALM